MRVSTPWKVTIVAVIFPPILFLAGCAKKEQTFEAPAPAEVSQFKVSGKVTHKGKPVPYGYVLFYGQKGVDQSGQTAPPAVGVIDSSGQYEVEHPVIGPVFVCVATDPDADVGQFHRAGSFGPPGGGPGGPPGGPS
jgi:hypothetical protein